MRKSQYRIKLLLVPFTPLVALIDNIIQLKKRILYLHRQYIQIKAQALALRNLDHQEVKIQA